MRALVLLPLLVALARPAAAQDLPDVAPPAGVEVEVRVGFGPGIARAGRACPVRVALRVARDAAPVVGRLSVEVWQESATAPRCAHDTVPLELAPGAAKRALLVFRVDRSRGVRVVVRDLEDRVLFRRSIAYGPGEGSLLRLEPQAALLGELPLADGSTRAAWPAAVASFVRLDLPLSRVEVTQPASVPLTRDELDARCLGGLTALLVPEPPGLATPAAAEVERWVAAGGRIVLAPGALGTAWPRDALAPLLPIEVTGQDQRPLTALAGAASGGGEAQPAAVLLGRPRPGARVLAAAGEDAPLITVWRYGKGAVCALGFPLGAPVSEAALAAHLREALALPTEQPVDVSPCDALERAGLEDLVDATSDATSAGWVGLVFLGFLLVVAPIDYLAWRRFPSPRVSWSVLAASSLGFSALAFSLGHTSEEPLVVRAVALVDVISPGADAPPRLAIDALLCLGSRRLEPRAVLAPEGLRWTPALPPLDDTVRAEPVAPDPRQTTAWAIERSRLHAVLGLGSAVPFRLSGDFEAEAPVAVSREGGALVLHNRTDGPLDLLVIRRGAPPAYPTLPPRSPRPLSDLVRPPAPGSERRSLSAVFHHLDPAVRASLALLAHELEEERLGQTDGLDVSEAYRRGDVLVLVTGLPFPAPLRDASGAKLQVEGTAVLRLVVPASDAPKEEGR